MFLYSHVHFHIDINIYDWKPLWAGTADQFQNLSPARLPNVVNNMFNLAIIITNQSQNQQMHGFFMPEMFKRHVNVF